jgi:hypothetical protein
MPDPDLGSLTALRQLRHAETDLARRDLSDALTREAALAAQHSNLSQELEATRQFSGEFDRDAFAAWFGRARAERERLAAAVREAEAHTVTTRTTLAHRRVAETAAVDALAAAHTAKKAATERREQLVLEDVARALKQTPG